jgi:hypothetical protein
VYIKKVKIHRTMLFPVFFFVWMRRLTLRMLDNRVLRQVFGHKRDEIARE